MNSTRWAALWAMLLDRFGQKSAETGAFYFDELTRRLTDEELTEGVRRVLYGSTFFPSPADIVAAARPARQTHPLSEWELCQRVMEGDRNALARMSPVGQRLVGMLGGEERLRNTSLESLPFVRKEWLALYQDAERVQEFDALAAGPTLAALPPAPQAPAVPLMQPRRVLSIAKPKADPMPPAEKP